VPEFSFVIIIPYCLIVALWPSISGCQLAPLIFRMALIKLMVSLDGWARCGEEGEGTVPWDPAYASLMCHRRHATAFFFCGVSNRWPEMCITVNSCFCLIDRFQDRLIITWTSCVKEESLHNGTDRNSVLPRNFRKSEGANVFLIFSVNFEIKHATILLLFCALITKNS
jgi:hypothetical protein